MKSVTLSEARKSFGRLIGYVQSTNRAVVISKRGIPAAFLTSYDAYVSREETDVVLSDPALMKEIRRGIRDLKTKRARLYTLEVLFSDK